MLMSTGEKAKDDTLFRMLNDPLWEAIRVSAKMVKPQPKSIM